MFLPALVLNLGPGYKWSGCMPEVCREAWNLNRNICSN
jgi:hypothetical protein